MMILTFYVFFNKSLENIYLNQMCGKDSISFSKEMEEIKTPKEFKNTKDGFKILLTKISM